MSLRFEVRRTSAYDDGERPCPEASAGKIPVWDVRTFKSPEEHDARFPERRWHTQGTEHQTVYGPRGGVQGIKRRMTDRDTWFVEFSTLADLMAFYGKHGDLVLRPSWSDHETPSIEIYDDYRE